MDCHGARIKIRKGLFGLCLTFVSLCSIFLIARIVSGGLLIIKNYSSSDLNMEQELWQQNKLLWNLLDCNLEKGCVSVFFLFLCGIWNFDCLGFPKLTGNLVVWVFPHSLDFARTWLLRHSVQQFRDKNTTNIFTDISSSPPFHKRTSDSSKWRKVTTGLDAQTDVLLEIAVIVTDKDF